ncbi:hypothetical protein F4604DRAFT_1802988, partial [Suillus subluteus]
FIDTLNISALLSAIPALEASMGITEIQSTWVFSGFRLTFSSFLLISGRLSDVYNPKTVFIGGASTLGILSLCAGNSFGDDDSPCPKTPGQGISRSARTSSGSRVLRRLWCGG